MIRTQHLTYVAGPYRAGSVYEISQNIERARALTANLWARGFPAVCPHTNTAFMDGIASDQVFLDGTLMMLERCDVVALVYGWRGSSGTMGEIERAIELGLPVFHDEPALYSYLAGGPLPGEGRIGPSWPTLQGVA